MSRTLAANTATQFAAAKVNPCVLVEIDYASGTSRLHSGVGNLTFNGNTYTGTGTLGAIADLEETVDESANGCTLTLSAASAVIALCLTEDVRGRPVRVWIGALTSETGTLVADPGLFFSGLVESMPHEDDGTNGRVTVKCVDETGDQERPLERRLTNEFQQQLHPGDLGLEYVTDLPNQQFSWGNASVAAANPGSPGEVVPPDNDNIGAP
jgi:hypothetical protein